MSATKQQKKWKQISKCLISTDSPRHPHTKQNKPETFLSIAKIMTSVSVNYGAQICLAPVKCPSKAKPPAYCTSTVIVWMTDSETQALPAFCLLFLFKQAHPGTPFLKLRPHSSFASSKLRSRRPEAFLTRVGWNETRDSIPLSQVLSTAGWILVTSDQS